MALSIFGHQKNSFSFFYLTNFFYRLYLSYILLSFGLYKLFSLFLPYPLYPSNIGNISNLYLKVLFKQTSLLSGPTGYLNSILLPNKYTSLLSSTLLFQESNRSNKNFHPSHEFLVILLALSFIGLQETLGRFLPGSLLVIHLLFLFLDSPSYFIYPLLIS